MRKTLKRRYKKKGGDIDSRNGLRYILSIGYEMETGTFSKLTRTEIVDNPDEIILYNTDTARKDILTFKSLSESEDFDMSELDEELISRMEEYVEEDAYNNKNEVDKNVIFNITNDVSITPFYRKLQKICNDDVDKNELYTFKTFTNEEYNIHFIFKDDRECAVFSNVEWLFTYLNPEQTPSIVIDTFTNAVTNLIRHLSDMEELEGNLLLKTSQGDFIIDDPEVRSLYHKPNTNLYYLQTHILDKKFTLDDECITSQMTFTCKIENLFLVMITLAKDNLNVIDTIHENSEEKLRVLYQVEACVNNLINGYNENQEDDRFKIIRKKSTIKIINKIIGYLQLIIFKLSRYYNNFMMIPKGKRKYLKDSLFFNVRHNNYSLYKEIKKNLQILFLPELTQNYGSDEKRINDKLVEIIQQIIVQPEILTRDLIDEDTKVRKNVFEPRNVIEKNKYMYGAPNISLISYLHFFENPTDTREFYNGNLTDEDEIYSYDWLDYAELDNKSARMDLNDDIIFVEFRGFQKLLSSYIYSIADDSLKNMMKTGACNLLSKKFKEDVGAISVGIFKKFLQLQEARSVTTGGRKTRKNRSKRNYIN